MHASNKVTTFLAVLVGLIGSGFTHGAQEDEMRSSPETAAHSSKTSWLWLPLNLMANLDADGDGRLQQHEFVPRADFWMEFDSNQDEALTLAELAIGLWQVESAANGSELGGNTRETESLPNSKSTILTRTRTRPVEATASRYGDKLPVDLPETFFELDRNRDGQVQMHEFSSVWSTEEVTRYQRYDQDRDGVITLHEWPMTEIKK